MIEGEGTQAERLKMNPEQFIAEFPTQWYHPEVEKSPIVQQVESMISGASQAIDKKVSQLAGHMAKNPRWSGCMGRVMVDGIEKVWQALSDLKPDVACATDEGAAMWLSVCKAHTFRFGPGSFPLPGIASLVAVAPSSPPAFLELLHVEPLLEQGIVLTNVSKFLETEEGAAYLKSRCVVVKLTSSQCVWLPFGWLVSPCTMSDPAAEATTSKSKKPEETLPDGVFVHIPFFNVKMANAQLGKPAAMAIKNYNQEFLQKKSGEALWAPRFQLFKSWAEQLEGH